MNNLDLTSIGYRVNSIEDIKLWVPAAFSNVAHPDRTEKYTHFSTEEFLEAFKEIGWNPYSAKQHGANPYSRHIIRLHNEESQMIEVNGEKIRPTLILDNSHDGYTPAQIHLGLYRVKTGCGIVIEMPGLKNTVKFRHIGENKKQLVDIISETAEQYEEVAKHIAEMAMVTLDDSRKKELAMKALSLREPNRFQDENGNPDTKEINKSVEIEDIYEPLRPGEEANDLWTVFNIIRERTVEGKYERKAKSGRKSSPRVITNAARHLVYNKKLWATAEQFIPENKKEIKVYVTAKNEEKEVEIITNLENGKTQVRPVGSNRVFAVDTNKLKDAVSA
jgi:predicted nucleotidyltransferase